MRLLTSLIWSSFHSISFPSEWGADPFDSKLHSHPIDVSIQLVSPASGEFNIATREPQVMPACFHSISFPSEWGALTLPHMSQSA